jgi:hemoglobin
MRSASVTIYEHYGGFSTVRRVVSAFYDKVLESDVIAHHFEEVQVPRLIEHQARFVSFLMGGPVSFTDDHLAHVHQRLGITPPEFEEMVGLLTETLDDFDFAPSDIDTVEREIRRRQPVIVHAA